MDRKSAIKLIRNFAHVEIELTRRVREIELLNSPYEGRELLGQELLREEAKLVSVLFKELTGRTITYRELGRTIEMWAE
jgi:hypothetical protein